MQEVRNANEGEMGSKDGRTKGRDVQRESWGTASLAGGDCTTTEGTNTRNKEKKGLGTSSETSANEKLGGHFCTSWHIRGKGRKPDDAPGD